MKQTLFIALFFALAISAQGQVAQAAPKTYTITLPVEAWDYLIGTMDTTRTKFLMWAPIRGEIFRQAGQQNRARQMPQDSVKAQPVEPKKN